MVVLKSTYQLFCNWESGAAARLFDSSTAPKLFKVHFLLFCSTTRFKYWQLINASYWLHL